MAHTIQEVCAGRLILGIGAGWNQPEHAALGLPFPDARQRLDLLEEASAGLRHAVDAPLLVGGAGERRTLRIAATHADVWHAWATPEEFTVRCRTVVAAMSTAMTSSVTIDTRTRAAGSTAKPASVRRATGAEIMGGLDDARLLASYETDEFIALFPATALRY